MFVGEEPWAALWRGGCGYCSVYGCWRWGRGSCCERCTRGEKYICPCGLCENGWVEGFEEAVGFGSEEVTVRVETGLHAGIQPPVWSEAERPSACDQDAQESEEQKQKDDEPVASVALILFILFKRCHGRVH